MKLSTRFTRTSTSQLVLLFVFATFSLNLFGQELLIEESLQPFNELSFSENEMLTKIQAQGMYTDYYLVEFGALADLQEDGRITINLPDDNCGDLIYKAKSVDYESEQDYTWYGVLETAIEDNGCHCRLGGITLISSEHGKIGHIMVDSKTYELMQLGENKYLLGKLDASKFTESECAVTNDAPIKSSGIDQKVKPRSSGWCEVRCLVLYTAAALDAEGNVAAINNRVNLAITQTNQALINSNLYPCQVSIELAGVQAYNAFEEESNFIGFDFQRFIDDEMDDVNQLRDFFEADIVVLLTDGEYGNVLGIAAIGPDETRPLAFVQTGAATTGRFTFAHEVAHLFGAGHDNDQRPGIPHGHNFKTGDFFPCLFGTRQRTIMNLLGFEGARIQHFSNPDVKFDGEKTGKDGTRDNAQQIANEACIVGQYEESVEPFIVYLGGDQFMCPCKGASLEATVIGGTVGATFDYDWFISNDGINWAPLLPYSGSNAIVSVPCTEGDGVFVRVEVEGSDGNTGSSTTFVEAATEWPGQEAPCLQFTGNGGAGQTLALSPNPSEGQSEAILQVYKESAYSITLNDTHGGIVKVLAHNQVLAAGTHHFPFDIPRNGLFFIHCVDQQGNQIIEKLLNF